MSSGKSVSSSASSSKPPPLDAPPQELRDVSPNRARALAALGIQRLGDLLEYLPRRYQYESAERTVADLVPEQIQTVRGRVIAVDCVLIRPRSRFEATIEDDAGNRLAAVWFNGAYLRSRIVPDQLIRMRGRVKFFRKRPQMVNPKWELIDESAPAIAQDNLRPIYSATARISSDAIASVVAANLDDAVAGLSEWFRPDLLERYQLLGRQQAYRWIHRPGALREAAMARRRLVWDELMLLQLGLGIAKRQRDAGAIAPVLKLDKLLDQRIRDRLGFVLTAAQDRAVWDVARDVGSGRPMNRLIQGDVGSGKTAVALYAMLLAVANGRQAALLAPTQVLAEQHLMTLTNLLAGSHVNVALYTGRTRQAQKRRLARDGSTPDLFGGDAQIAVGTQALLENDIAFANLGLVVVDEQHKLGVHQRAVLRGKGSSPHYLIMTATPIPRTLALSYFADFDLSVIDELPPGRQPIQTRWLRRTEAARAYEFIRKQVAAGRQAYVVLPQIDEGFADDGKSVRKEFQRLKTGDLSGLRLEMLHGQLQPDEKQYVMSRFRDGNVDVLVTTTVIEVGIDVPNATVILIDNAERFGLSQLHQLRGRVGRGRHASHCLLIADAATPQAQERLETMTRTSDGFEIAEMDLKLRGTGEFFGTRQHGLPELKIADLSEELPLLQKAREEALAILAVDPNLRRPPNQLLRRELIARFGTSLQLAQIG
jgi:ATP-dependent DNA helicase RecG